MPLSNRLLGHTPRFGRITIGHALSFVVSGLVALIFILDLRAISAGLFALDSTALRWIIELGLAGAVPTLLVLSIYLTDELPTLLQHRTTTTASAVVNLVIVIGLVGLVNSVVLQLLFSSVPYFVVHGVGLLFLLIIGLVHLLTSWWGVDRTIPYLLAGTFLLIAPLL